MSLLLTPLRGAELPRRPQKLGFRVQSGFPQGPLALQVQLLKGRATGTRFTVAVLAAVVAIIPATVACPRRKCGG